MVQEILFPYNLVEPLSCFALNLRQTKQSLQADQPNTNS